MAIAKQVNNKEGKKDIFARSTNPGVPSRLPASVLLPIDFGIAVSPALTTNVE